MGIKAITNKIATIAAIWIDSDESIIFHTIFFLLFALVIPFLGLLSWTLSLLILTTVVSLEAIYLEMFIQRTVKQHTEHLKDVAEDIDELQEKHR